MKRFFIVLASLVVAFSSFSFQGLKVEKANAEPSLKPIDMYLIAGQSNAAGYSSAKDGQTLPSGEFDGFMYGGQVDRVIANGMSKQNLLTFDSFKNSVTKGLGASANQIGPEYGMAKVMSANYDSSNPAFIFKSAAGGTSLKDFAANLSSGSSAYGNWYPRSLWTDGYTPSLEVGASDYTGVQYMLFVENFKKVYNELISHGYKPTVKGMVWMQGEDDMGAGCDGYDKVLTAFINDIRADLVSITGDFSLIEMPFVAGKIQNHFALHNNPGAPLINGMISSVAEKLENVATVETEDLVMVNADGTFNGPDKYHFSVTDAETLGERFGQKLMEMEVGNNSRLVVSPVENGSVEYELNQENGTVLFKNITPDYGYHLSSMLIKNGGTEYRVYFNGDNSVEEGEDLFVNLKDYIADYDTTYTRVTLSLSFSQEKYRLNIENDQSKGAVFNTPNGLVHSVGEELLITVNPKEGYIVKEVTFNGVIIEANENGRYLIVMTAEENNLKVTYELKVDDSSSLDSSSSNSSKPTTPSSGGCSGSLNGGIFALLGLAIFGKVLSSREK